MTSLRMRYVRRSHRTGGSSPFQGQRLLPRHGKSRRINGGRGGRSSTQFNYATADIPDREDYIQGEPFQLTERFLSLTLDMLQSWGLSYWRFDPSLDPHHKTAFTTERHSRHCCEGANSL